MKYLKPDIFYPEKYHDNNKLIQNARDEYEKYLTSIKNFFPDKFIKIYNRSDDNGTAFHDFAIRELSILGYKEKYNHKSDRINLLLNFDDIDYYLIIEKINNFYIDSKSIGYLGEILLCELGLTNNGGLSIEMYTSTEAIIYIEFSKINIIKEKINNF